MIKQSKLPVLTLLLASVLPAQGAQASSLDAVLKQGVVKCGINEKLPGFSNKDASGNWKGLDIDMCRAVAAAVFGDASCVEYIPVSASDRFKELSAGTFDLRSRNTTWNMSRDTGMKVTFVGENY